MFAKIKDFFDQLWFIISPFIAWIGRIFEEIQLVALQKIFYLFSILVLIIGVFELIKNRKYRKSGMFKSKAEKTTELALSPEKQAEEMIRTISTYRKVVKFMLQKIKKFFSYIWCNKETICAILLDIGCLALIEYLTITQYLMEIPFFHENVIWLSLAGGVLTIVIVIFLIHSVGFNIGFENIKDYKKRIENKLIEREKKLTPEELKIYKEEKKNITSELKEVTKKYTSVASKIDHLEKFKELMDGVLDPQKDYELAKSTQEKANLEVKKQELEAQLSKLNEKKK